MTINATIEALRDLVHETVPVAPDTPQVQRPLGESEVVGRAILALPPDVWGDPVVRDYCAADQRLALLAQWPGDTMVRWAHAVKGVRGPFTVAALHYAGKVQGHRNPLCDAAQELWRRRGFGGAVNDKGQWYRTMYWIADGECVTRDPAFGKNRDDDTLSISFHWEARFAAHENSEPVLALGMWWHDEQGLKVQTRISPRLANLLDTLRAGGGTPANIQAVNIAMLPFRRIKFKAPEWLTAHLSASADPTAQHLASILREGANP